ncbi:MAG: response regulator, partial [Verrucomicrobia bacterium]|nr:response regulator [Verrucomicrobiota bacterium]
MKPTSNPAPPPVRPKVLIVDDEPVILQLLYETLNSAGYEATVAGDAQQGLERLKGTEYALILSDNQMPGMRGLEFFSKTRELQPFATRILITGIVDVETLLSSINTGELFRFVIKPWVREELLATVRNGIQRHELLRENERLHIETRQRNQQLQKANAGLEESLKREIMQARELDRLNQALNGNLERSVELSVKTLQTFYPTLGSRAR